MGNDLDGTPASRDAEEDQTEQASHDHVSHLWHSIKNDRSVVMLSSMPPGFKVYAAHGTGHATSGLTLSRAAR